MAQLFSTNSLIVREKVLVLCLSTGVKPASRTLGICRLNSVLKRAHALILTIYTVTGAETSIQMATLQPYPGESGPTAPPQEIPQTKLRARFLR